MGMEYLHTFDLTLWNQCKLNIPFPSSTSNPPLLTNDSVFADGGLVPKGCGSVGLDAPCLGRRDPAPCLGRDRDPGRGRRGGGGHLGTDRWKVETLKFFGGHKFHPKKFSCIEGPP